MADFDVGTAGASQSQSSEDVASQSQSSEDVASQSQFIGVIRPLVLKMEAGSNIIQSLQQFCLRTDLGIYVLLATGSVTNVTLRQAGTVGQPPMILQGIFEMKNLSGCLLPPSWNIPSSVFLTSLESPQGWIGGEIVGNHFIAAGTVSIVVTPLIEPVYHNLYSTQENNYTNNDNGNGNGSHGNDNGNGSHGNDNGSGSHGNDNGSGSHGNGNVLPSSAHQGQWLNNVFQIAPAYGQTWPISASGYLVSANGHPYSAS